MNGQEILQEQIQDLLALEVLARDVFAEALSLPGIAKLEKDLARLKADEERHIGLVKKMISILEGKA